jgi:FlaA1/EpsC-like NDP-sugar epimerase
MLNTQQLKRYRTVLQTLYDAACWAVALAVATTLRYDFTVGNADFGGVARFLPVVVVGQLVAGTLFGMYRGRWRFGSFDEALALGQSVLLASALGLLANGLIDPQPVPRSVPVAGGVMALVFMGAGRYAWRLTDERGRRPQGSDCERLLVFGAGEAGAKIIRAMLSNPQGAYLPVALLDDDPAKKNLRIMGVPVVGTRDRIAAAAVDHHASAMLIALPSAGAALVTELSDLAVRSGLAVKVLPPVHELLGGNVDASHIRDITAADLLGRHEIETDLDSIAGYLTGKRVLVTGAGGSIGSELCRQIYRFAPSELIMLDRDESALHAVQLSIYGQALLDSPDLVLVDLRDEPVVHRVLAERRPQVIFHAAALKHLPILERHPAEAVKTNVWATLTLMERLAAHMTNEGSTVCLSVRFGNVLGSRGSVLTTFQAQIDRGGPITVTDPDVTRYFMTVEEAVQLVIQAGAIGSGGEVLVLDMGQPVKIDEVARLLASRSERRISLHYTGLRGGEKLHEVLFGADEADDRPRHPLISHVPATPVEPQVVRQIHVDDVTLEIIVNTLARMSRHASNLAFRPDYSGG